MSCTCSNTNSVEENTQLAYRDNPQIKDDTFKPTNTKIPKNSTENIFLYLSKN